MVDLVILGLFTGLVIRGWLRGLVREAIDVATLALGVLLAFRMASTTGGLVARLTGLSPEVGRLFGGVAVFLAVSIGAAVAARLINKTMRVLPGLTTLNRLGGAGLGFVYAFVLVLLAVTVLAVVPVPPALAVRMDDSMIAAKLTDPEGTAQRTVGTIAGDRATQAVIALRRVAGERSIVSGAVGNPTLPPVEESRLRADSAAAQDVFDALNRARVDNDLAPLAWSDGLEVVAVARAGDMYRAGSFTPEPQLSIRLTSAGIPSTVRGESVALAATPEGAHEALLASDLHSANLLSPDYRRVGAGIIAGPFGLMSVLVFTG